MESGRTKALKAETILRLAQSLNVSAYWLETGRGSPAPDARLLPEESEVLTLYRTLTAPNRDAWVKVGQTLLATQSVKASPAIPFLRAKK